MQNTDVLFHSTKQHILQIAKWNKVLNRLIWILFFILVIFEGIGVLCHCLGLVWDSEFSNTEYILSYFIKPTLVLFVTILIAKCIDRALARRHKVLLRSWFVIFVLVLLCTEVITFHYGVSVVYALYAIPIAASLIYTKHQMLFAAYLSSLIMYILVLVYIVTFIPQGNYHHNFIDALGNIGLLTAVYIICRMALSRTQEVIDTAVNETVLRMQLSHEVTLDSSTQLYNHATFYERLDAFIIAYNNNSTNKFSLILFDIDDFKKINDTYGHDAGDHVILRLVDMIKGNIDNDDLAFRYGGEEFAVLTMHTESVEKKADSIREGFEKQIFHEIPHKVTVSIGISTYDYNFGGKREFFSSADKALYQAKRSGKNRICVADADAY